MGHECLAGMMFLLSMNLVRLQHTTRVSVFLPALASLLQTVTSRATDKTNLTRMMLGTSGSKAHPVYVSIGVFEMSVCVWVRVKNGTLEFEYCHFIV